MSKVKTAVVSMKRLTRKRSPSGCRCPARATASIGPESVRRRDLQASMRDLPTRARLRSG
jgi:hypothetical protein